MYFRKDWMQGWRQYAAVFTCALSVAASAAAFTWMEPLILRMKEEFDLNPSQSSWLVSSVEFGELAFMIPVCILGDRYGRKLVLLSTGPVCLISWVLILCSKSIYVLYLVRLLQGASLSLVFGLAPLYIAEVAEPKVRGMLAGQFQTMWAFGILLTYVTGSQLSLQLYIGVCASVALIFTVLFFFMPETPYFLLMTNREDAAAKSLEWLRGTRQISIELENMKKSVRKDMENKASWKELFVTAKARRTFFTVQLLCFLKYMIGSPAMSCYAAETFSHASHGAINEHQASIIFGLLLLLSAFFGSFLSDSIGRRPLLIGTCFLIGISYTFTAGYFFLNEHTDAEVESYTWIMYSSIALATVLSNIGPSSLLQTIQGELFPSNTRAMGSALTGFTASIATFLDLKQYQTAVELFGLYMNFVIFASFALGGSILLFFILRETAGKTLGEIQTDLDFTESIPPHDVASFPNQIEVISGRKS